MNHRSLLDLVDDRAWRFLFIDELGWSNPDQPDAHLEVDSRSYELKQVASYKGLRIWYCAELPGRSIQRALDQLIGRDSHERLVIFADDSRQEWRWPRRSSLSGVNSKLLVHQHSVGQLDSNLDSQLQAIKLGFDDDLSLPDLLSRMRIAFDSEAESASVQAARLMGTLYNELEAAGADEYGSTLILARLLFLLFGDDTSMWATAMFHEFVRDNCTGAVH